MTNREKNTLRRNDLANQICGELELILLYARRLQRFNSIPYKKKDDIDTIKKEEEILKQLDDVYHYVNKAFENMKPIDTN